VTFRTLLEKMQAFARKHPDHEALDEHVVLRVQTNEDSGGDLHPGGLRGATIDAGCTDTFALVLDADQEPDEPRIRTRRSRQKKARRVRGRTADKT